MLITSRMTGVRKLAAPERGATKGSLYSLTMGRMETPLEVPMVPTTAKIFCSSISFSRPSTVLSGHVLVVDGDQFDLLAVHAPFSLTALK